jgi:hypothetical protein
MILLNLPAKEEEKSPISIPQKRVRRPEVNSIIWPNTKTF